MYESSKMVNYCFALPYSQGGLELAVEERNKLTETPVSKESIRKKILLKR
jgi:hypothetical protein